MITDDQLIEYQAGRMPAGERARFEEMLAEDGEALRRLMEQERTEAALRFLTGGAKDRSRVKQGILEVALGVSQQDFKREVVAEVRGKREREAEGTFTIWNWLARNWASLGTAAALGCVAVIFWFGRGNQPSQRAAAPVTRLAADNQSPRYPAQWPFSAESPWNTPIGAKAVYEDIDPAGVDVELGAYIADWRETHPLVYLEAVNPSSRIFLRDNANPAASFPIPRKVLQESDWRVAMHLINGPEVIELTEVTVLPSGDLVAAAMRRADLRGSGIPFEFESATRSGLTTLAGAIRKEELTNGIRHALGAVIPIDAMSAKEPGFIWPAAWAPEDASFKASYSRAGNVIYGSLLAIPASVDLASLGIPTNSVAYEIGRALQDYGMYVKDVFFTDGFPKWKAAGSPDLVFCAEFEWEAMPNEFPEQIRRLIRELKLVTNNGLGSVGGGGTSRRLPAPEFAKVEGNDAR